MGTTFGYQPGKECTAAFSQRSVDRSDCAPADRGSIGNQESPAPGAMARAAQALQAGGHWFEPSTAHSEKSCKTNQSEERRWRGPARGYHIWVPTAGPNARFVVSPSGGTMPLRSRPKGRLGSWQVARWGGWREATPPVTVTCRARVALPPQVDMARARATCWVSGRSGSRSCASRSARRSGPLRLSGASPPQKPPCPLRIPTVDDHNPIVGSDDGVGDPAMLASELVRLGIEELVHPRHQLIGFAVNFKHREDRHQGPSYSRGGHASSVVCPTLTEVGSPCRSGSRVAASFVLPDV